MPAISISSALILSRGRLYAAMLVRWLSQENTVRHFSGVGTVREARALVCEREFDILISTLEASDADVLDRMFAWSSEGRSHRGSSTNARSKLFPE